MARRGSGGALFEGAEEKRDRELTLGPGTLAILGVGLLTLCGVCFTFGYVVGHRSPGITLGLQQAIATSSGPSLPASNQPKPSASEDPFVPAAQPASTTTATAPAAQPTVQTTTTPAAGNPMASLGTTPAPAVVQTALNATPASVQSAGSNGLVHPALPQGSGWVVQVAAVSQTEDADVLLTALRRRGYAVSVRHDPADNLMHVQVGPFASHNDASAMRQRLLNDGYNAIIQP